MKSKLLAGKGFDLKSLTQMKAKEPESNKSGSSIIDK